MATVLRILVLVIAMLVVADTTGIVEACDAACLDDAEGKPCPPACPNCVCVGHAVTPVPAAPVAVTGATPSHPRPLAVPALVTILGQLVRAPALRPPILPC